MFVIATNAFACLPPSLRLVLFTRPPRPRNTVHRTPTMYKYASSLLVIFMVCSDARVKKGVQPDRVGRKHSSHHVDSSPKIIQASNGKKQEAEDAVNGGDMAQGAIIFIDILSSGAGSYPGAISQTPLRKCVLVISFSFFQAPPPPPAVFRKFRPEKRCKKKNPRVLSLDLHHNQC